jgi:hypothetical protein
MKTDYKVGDYIIFRDKDVLEIKTIIAVRYHDLWIQHTPASFSGGGFSFKDYEQDIRLATPQEIIAAGFKPQSKIYELW